MDEESNAVGLATSPPDTPSPTKRQSTSHYSATDMPVTTNRRPSIPMFYPHSHQKQGSTSSSGARHLSSYSNQPPPIPTRNSSISPTEPTQAAQTPYIITPTAITAPLPIHSYAHAANYPTTIRPVSLDPVPEHDDGTSTHVSPMTMVPARQ